MMKKRYWLIKPKSRGQTDYAPLPSLRNIGAYYGFTLVEVIMVVVILAIAAVLAIPMLSAGAATQVSSAANIIAADLEYAKSMAISRGQNYSVVFDKANEKYQIEIEGEPGTPIKHPVTKDDFVINFQSDSRLSKVDIYNVVFDSSSGTSQTITFDSLGSPYSDKGASKQHLNSGVITLQPKGSTGAITVNVEAVTGYISISE